MSHSDSSNHIKILKTYPDVSEYTFREKESHEVVDETIFLTFVESDRFDKKPKGLRKAKQKVGPRGKMEVARAMKAKGLGMALIAELTGLSEEEIRQS